MSDSKSGSNLPKLGAAGDEFVSMLMDAYQGLSEQQCNRLNMQLAIILADRLGDAAQCKQALRKAIEGVAAKKSD